MNEREKIIRLWFDMWIKKADLGIDNILQMMLYILRVGVLNMKPQNGKALV